MPCRDYDTDPPNYKPELDKVTRMLCAVLTDIDHVNSVFDTHGAVITIKEKITFSREIQEWWKKHKEADRKREEAELAAKRSAESAEILTLKRLQAKYPHIK